MVRLNLAKQPAKSGSVVVTNSVLSSSGNTLVPLSVRISSANGVPFKQPGVLIYAKGIVNNGTPGLTCSNYAYTDETGIATMPTFITKAGGYSLVLTNAGTLSTPAVGLPGVPEVPAGASLTTTAFNLKNNGTTRDNLCDL